MAQTRRGYSSVMLKTYKDPEPRAEARQTSNAPIDIRQAASRRRDSFAGRHLPGSRRARDWAAWKPLPGLVVLQHHANVVRITARLARWGVPRAWARFIARSLERVIRPWF